MLEHVQYYFNHSNQKEEMEDYLSVIIMIMCNLGIIA